MRAADVLAEGVESYEGGRSDREDLYHGDYGISGNGRAVYSAGICMGSSRSSTYCRLPEIFVFSLASCHSNTS